MLVSNSKIKSSVFAVQLGFVKMLLSVSLMTNVFCLQLTLDPPRDKRHNARSVWQHRRGFFFTHLIINKAAINLVMHNSLL